MSKKRILITEVSGECRHVRVVKGAIDMEDGYYCAACPHSGWERIDPKQCENCTREKHLSGKSREEVVDTVAKILCKQDSDEGYCEDCACYGNKNACNLLLSDEGYIARAEEVLDAILEAKKWS